MGTLRPGVSDLPHGNVGLLPIVYPIWRSCPTRPVLPERSERTSGGALCPCGSLELRPQLTLLELPRRAMRSPRRSASRGQDPASFADAAIPCLADSRAHRCGSFLAHASREQRLSTSQIPRGYRVRPRPAPIPLSHAAWEADRNTIDEVGGLHHHYERVAA
jgi:hypothetical protein